LQFALLNEAEITQYEELKSAPDIGNVDESVLPKDEDLDPQKLFKSPDAQTTIIDYSAYDSVITQAQEQNPGSDAT
jgi:hypothetical protein